MTGTRREWLQRCCGFAGAVVSARAAAPRRPNFVFILIDDMGWADVGCFGSRYYETPNIDRLCGQGMKFTDAYAAAPVCSPTRASIMTGKYPARLQMTDIVQGHNASPKQPLLPPDVRPALPLGEVTIAEALKQAGYVSASIGKWHLGARGFYPEDQGFDINVAGNHVGMPNDYFYPAWKLSRFGPLHAYGGVPLEGKPGEYLTDRLADAACEFLDRHKDRPFFLYLSHYAVHIPMQARKDLIAKYERKTSSDDPQHNPIYAAMVDSVDRSVGAVMKKVEDLGLADQTVFIFMSDNGGLVNPQRPNNLPPTSNLPLRAGKGHLYEGGIREPLIVKWPGVTRPGSATGVPVISTDFYPTILEMAGIRRDPGNPADGVSLAPLLRGKGRPKRDTLYWHWPHYAILTAKPASAIRRGDWKLIEFLEDRRTELYNLAEDIGETKDLSGGTPAKRDELLNALRKWRKSVNAGMMTPNPKYDPNAK